MPANIENLTRVEQNFTPSPNTSITTVFEDFNTTNVNDCYSGTNTCTVGGGLSVTHSIVQIPRFHDPSLKVFRINWTAAGADKNLQINWRPPGVGVNINSHQTFDFRISRNPIFLNPPGATNFSIQLVMANGDLSNAVKLCNYAYVDGPVGGYRLTSPGLGTAEYRPVLKTVRIPLTAFASADLSQIRGIKITFNESSTGSINLANLRFTK